MPLEPIPWDRKESFRERKRENSESIGSVARWRGSSSHHGSGEFNRATSDFRRLAGHGKQGGWRLFPEESGHRHVLSRSSDKIQGEDNFLPSVSRGNGKYGRSSKESRGAFSQREWRRRSWDATNGSLNLSRRHLDTNNRRSVDDMLKYSSHPHSDFVNTWEQHHMKDQHDKMGGVNGLGTGQRCGRDSSLGTIDWKPLKWTRSSLSSRETGFSHSSSSRSIGGTNLRGSCEGKVGLQHKKANAVESNLGEAATCGASSASSEEKNSRKKPRLNWGEGLAKFERKNVEGPDVTANKDDPVSPHFNMEPSNFLSSSLVDKSPKVSGFSDCVSPATPSSVACSSSPGADDKLFGKAANVDSDVSNLSSSPSAGSQSHLQMFSFNLEKVDIDSLTSLGSSLVELLQSDGLSSVDSSLLSSTTMNKLLILKADISKVLEVTETEIDLLEKELMSLKSESGDRFPCSAAVGSILVCYNAKSSGKHVGGSDKVARREPLVISSDYPNLEKMPLSTNLLDTHDNFKEDDIDSSGAVMSKFVKPLPMINAVSSCDVGTCSEDLDGIQSTAVKSLIPCTYRRVASVSTCGDDNLSFEVKEGMDAKSSASFYSSTEDILYNTIISCNKESAKTACEVFAKLLPKECGKIDNIGASSGSCSHNGALIMEKIAEKKRFARFKERVITLKFKALHHLWREDMRLLSIRKYHPKSLKKRELDLRTVSNSHQKKRSSIRFRFPFPGMGNQIRLVPTSEMIDYTSQLLSESQNEIHRSTLKMPALILDQKEKMMSKFLSGNGLVEDPLAIEKERAMINPWTSEEREIFLEKFAAFGKDFRKIASFLNHKTTADCVEFYYKNHKSDIFEKIKRKDIGKLANFFKAKNNLMASGRKWNSEVSAASLEILSAASVMADGIAGNRKMRPGSSLWRGYGSTTISRGEDSIPERSNSFDILRDERETVAANVLVGICGSLSSEAVSSCTTSSVDPVEGNSVGKCLKVRPLSKHPVMPDVTQNIDDESYSDESCGEMDPSDWTDGEKAALLQAVSTFGRDFAMIAECVGTRSHDQCKAFFSKTRKCLGLDLVWPRPENVGALVNDEDGGRSDTDDACVVESGSVIGTATSGTKTDENQASSDMNTFHDESNPVEARKMSADLDESKDITAELDHQEVNMVSNACVIGGESKLGTDGNGVVLNSFNMSCSVRDQRAIIMSDSIEIGKDKPNKVGGADTVLVSASEINEPCHAHSVAKDRLVSEVSSGHHGNELEGSPISLVDKDEADTDVVVELKDNVHNSSTSANTALSSVGISCSRLSFDAENQPQLCLKKPHFSGSSEDPLANANSMFKNTDGSAVQCKKTSQDLLSCDFQGNGDMSGHNSTTRNHGYQLHNSGNLLNHLKAARILQCDPLQVPVKKEVRANMSCSSSATELPLQSQKIEQPDDHCTTQLQCLSDSEKTPRNGDVKLFGKILTNPSSTQKPNLNTKGDKENGTHHPKLSSASPSLKFASHHNTGGKSDILKVDHNDHQGFENVPVMSFCGGNKTGSGFSLPPDSTILPVKNRAASINCPTSDKLEQQSLQVLDKNDEQNLNGASSITTREVNGSNGVFDHQMFRNGDGQKVQPFMVDENHSQDVFSELKRRNGFEAISSIQQQGNGMVGMNSVGKPGTLVGGSQSVVSDPVAAIKMHHSNADQYGDHTEIVMREDEGGGDLGS